MKTNPYFDGPLWNWFGLSYSSYLVLPRTLLCGMPPKWQERMVALLAEMHEVYETDALEDNYLVTLRGKGGRFKLDPWANYKYPPELPYKVKSGFGAAIRSILRRLFP